MPEVSRMMFYWLASMFGRKSEVKRQNEGELPFQSSLVDAPPALLVEKPNLPE
jgi:hypothetical protein